MWTDEHISRQLLEFHLNPKLDLASRLPESIDKTIDFILGFCHKTPMEILDLGCGPGLYLERLAKAGHKTTGVDFSENSIAYAKKNAKEKNLSIQYECRNYLDLDYTNHFDLIMMIYTDFGVLVPEERKILLENIYRALKPNGLFVFDVVNDKNLDEKFKEHQTWSFENGSFWKPAPYLELKSGFHYPDDKVFLQQHTIVDKNNIINNYRFWTHYFNHEDITYILSPSKFIHTRFFENVLPGLSTWSGENITFYKTEKSIDNQYI